VRSHAEAHRRAFFNNDVVADHPRHFRREPDHLRSLALSAGSGEEARRPCATAPLSRTGIYQPGLAEVRAKLKQHAGWGTASFVKVLGRGARSWVGRRRGLPARKALKAGIASGDVILTVLCQAAPAGAAAPALPRLTPLRLRCEPHGRFAGPLRQHKGRSPDGAARDPGGDDRS